MLQSVADPTALAIAVTFTCTSHHPWLWAWSPSICSHPLPPCRLYLQGWVKVIVADPAVLPPSSFLRPGYPGARSAGAYSGAMFSVQHRPLSGYNPHAGLPMPPMTAMSQQVAIPSHQSGIPPQMAAPIHAMPQPLSAVPQPMTVPALAPQQAPKAYTTNYTVPMELMKRDRSLATMSPMPSPHASPQVMRKAGVSSDRALVPIGGAVPGQNVSLTNQMLSRRTGPPVIVSTMASPDTSKWKPSSIAFFMFSFFPLLHPLQCFSS